MRPGTRTLDIQNRYPVPQRSAYAADAHVYKDVTHTGSNTWRHNNDWYHQNMHKLIKKQESESESESESCDDEGYTYGAEHKYKRSYNHQNNQNY